MNIYYYLFISPNLLILNSEFKTPASLMGPLVKCYESFGWIDVRRATPVQVQS